MQLHVKVILRCLKLNIVISTSTTALDIEMYQDEDYLTGCLLYNSCYSVEVIWEGLTADMHTHAEALDISVFFFLYKLCNTTF